MSNRDNAVYEVEYVTNLEARIEQLQVDNERLTFLCRKLADKPPLPAPPKEET